MANKALLALGVVGAGLGAYFFLAPKEASAAEEEEAADEVLAKPPAPRPRTAIPRRGPNGTVLLADLPAECKGYYDVAFGQTTSSACSDALVFGQEVDRQYQLYLAGDPFFEQEQYDAVLKQYEAAYARCAASQLTEQEAIDAWVECLRKNGLTPQEVWAG